MFRTSVPGPCKFSIFSVDWHHHDRGHESGARNVGPAAIAAALRNTLTRDDGQEEVIFATYQPSTGRTRSSPTERQALLRKLEQFADAHADLDVAPLRRMLDAP